MTTETKPIAGRHLVRYGIAADQKFLLGDFLKTYDQIILNANIVAHMPGALANFLTERAKNKPYFIDPQTHAFQHQISHLASTVEATRGKIKLKRTIRKLLDEYGEPVQTCVGSKHNSVLPDDFKTRKVRKGFCERVIRFQLDAIQRETQDSDSAKYYQYRAKKGQGELKSAGPSLVVAPYFCLTSATFERWLQVNLDCALDSHEYAQSQHIPLGVQIVVSRDVLLNGTLRVKLSEAYKNAKIKAAVLLVWVDAFSEHTASADELRAFIDLLNRLGDIAPLVNLYGGFLSVALSRCGVARRLVGVAHGLEYGEDRGVIPVGGGFPIAKYYLPSLHARLPFREAFRAVRSLGGLKTVDDFLSQVCACKECKQVIRTQAETDFARYGETRTITFMRGGHVVRREIPTPETREHCVRHYMWQKAREYKGRTSRSQLVQELREAERKLARALGLANVSHCGVWRKILHETTNRP